MPPANWVDDNPPSCLCPTVADAPRHGPSRRENGSVTTIAWPDVWADLAARMAAHRRAGRGHLLTEDTVRLETVRALAEFGVLPERLAAEVLVPVLAGGKLDLVVDPPNGTVIELKYPRDSRTGISPDTMTF